MWSMSKRRSVLLGPGRFGPMRTSRWRRVSWLRLCARHSTATAPSTAGGAAPSTRGPRCGFGLARRPLLPRDVPVAKPVRSWQRGPHRVDHFNDVPAFGVVVEPDGVARADVEAAMAGIRVTLAADRPRRGVHKDAAVADLRRPFHVGAIPVRRVDRYAVGRRIHDDVGEPLADEVNAVVGRGAVLAHRRRHGPYDLAVASNGHDLGVVIGRRDDLIADGEVRGDVFLAEQAVAEVDAVGVDRDVDGRPRLPALSRAPAHFAIVQPVEGAIHGWVGGDLDGLLSRQPVRDLLIQADLDGLTHAD